MTTNNSLLADSSRAFRDELYTIGGAIDHSWVSKRVTKKEYKKSYSFWKYRIIKKDDRHVTVVFRMPTHLISPSVTKLTNSEISDYQLW